MTIVSNTPGVEPVSPVNADVHTATAPAPTVVTSDSPIATAAAGAELPLPGVESVKFHALPPPLDTPDKLLRPHDELGRTPNATPAAVHVRFDAARDENTSAAATVAATAADQQSTQSSVSAQPRDSFPSL